MTGSDDRIEGHHDSLLAQKMIEFIGNYVGDLETKSATRINALRQSVLASALIPVQTTGLIFQLAAQATRNDQIAIDFCESINMRAFGPLSLACECATNLQDIVRIVQKYASIDSNPFHLQSIVEGERVAVVHTLYSSFELGGKYFADGLLAHFLMRARNVLKQDIAPVAVEVMARKPRDDRTYRRFFRAPIQFGSRRNALIFTKAIMQRAAPDSNPEILAFLESYLDNLVNTRSVDIISRVELLIDQELSNGKHVLPSIAAALAMTPRTLQRRLAAEGIGFTSILENVRKRRASDYLQQEIRPQLSDLAVLLGYSDATAASRFMRLKGVDGS